MINFKLKATRVAKNKDQKFMAKILGISVQTYSKKECGKREFTANEIQLIIDTFDLSPEQIKEIFFTKELNTKGKSA